jgi:hypothetical protein
LCGGFLARFSFVWIFEYLHEVGSLEALAMGGWAAQGYSRR